ncbi:hypothetical protein FH966_03565 [Lentibacillus cibarius]|uniref:Uncharacterized protein n=1 Tax=Lentibacillus cibarius TaxID=2583219 RepID=A0A549YG56_9BACI|nr:hypothetical protein [Lentibacillus cibarius]TRM10870.1 hypothetical protein FH966_03565 [Lentibacillus cibarius]
MPTKMALDVYKSYGKPVPETAFKCLKETASELLNKQGKKSISYGDYLQLIKGVDNKFKNGFYFLSKKQYKKYLNKATQPLLNKQNSIKKLKVIMDIHSKFKNSEVNIDKNAVKEYIYSRQLQNGSFPIYDDKNNNADTLTTFYAVDIMKKKDIKVPKKIKLIKYLKDNVTAKLK